MEDRKYVLIYRSYVEAIRMLPKDEQLTLFDAILDYGFNGTDPKLSGASAGMWVLIKPNVEANFIRYQNGKKGAEHGKKGGRPKKSDNENENKKEIESENENEREISPKKPQSNPKETPKKPHPHNIDFYLNQKKLDKDGEYSDFVDMIFGRGQKHFSMKGVLSMNEQLSCEQYNKLREVGATKKYIIERIIRIDNEPKYQKDSLFKTLLLWWHQDRQKNTEYHPPLTKIE